MNSLLKNTILGIGGAALMIGTSVASAAQATGTFQATASVNPNCLVSANDLAFGAYDPSSATDLDVNTTISVRCTRNTAFTVALNAGVTAGATLAQRRMTNGTDFMNFNLYTTAARATIFGDGTGGTGTIPGTGAGMGVPQAQGVTVYGRIPAGQTLLSTGTYTETTITATVTY